MSRLIADILEINPVQFKHMIEQWENKSGRQGHDLRLYSEMRRQAVSAIKELGLDPSDTVSGELYFALQERAKIDNSWLAEYVGVSIEDSPEKMVEKIIAWINKHNKYMDVWTCKTGVMRAIIKNQPPKSAMKVLGLKSVDSMLKRNQPAEILVLADVFETSEWAKRFKSNYKKLKPSDFDQKKIQLTVISTERKNKLEKAGFPVNRFVCPQYELGAIMIMPPKNRFPLDVLACMLSITEMIADLRKHSSFYRTLSVRKDFGQKIYDTSLVGITRASLAMSDIGWNSLHRHLVGNDYFISKIEQPFLSGDDLKAVSSMDLLASKRPELAYWKNLEYAIFYDHSGYATSLNLVDVAINGSNRFPHHKGTKGHAQAKLWEELWSRYLHEESVASEVIDAYIHH